MNRLIARSSALCLAVLLVSVAPATAAKKSKLASHPDKLKHGELRFDVPDAADYRHELKNGATAYVAEDHALPLVNISITLRTGGFLEPEDKTGLASMTGTMMRRGGTAGMSAEDFDERADFLAANMSTFIGDTRGGASVNCITQVVDDCLDMFFDMMKNPRFQQDRLDVEKDNLLEQLKQRNDRPQSISSREWAWLLYGTDHFSTRVVTEASLDAISREDLKQFHARYWRPDQMTFAVSGDVDTKQILSKLDEHLAGWKVEGPPIPWPPPTPSHQPQPGLYQSEKDIPQGRVLIGHLGLERQNWNDPDAFALQVMNNILGGGGFTSRLTKRVRSDEGLAYSAGSVYSIGQYWPGSFFMYFQSKSPTVALAAKISVEELRKMTTELVTQDELDIAKNFYIEAFPRRFESKQQVVGTFVDDDYVGRPHDYWDDYRANIGKVGVEEVRAAAKEYLHPDRLVYLVVGKWEEIEPGDADGKASMKEFHGGKVTRLPERDPLTMEPVR